MTQQQYLKAIRTIRGDKMTGVIRNKIVKSALDKFKKLMPKHNWEISINSSKGNDITMKIVLKHNGKEIGSAIYLVSSGEISDNHHYKKMTNDYPTNVIDWILDIFCYEGLAKDPQ